MGRLELRLQLCRRVSSVLISALPSSMAISSSSIRFRSFLIRVLMRSVSRFAEDRLTRRSIRSRFISRVNSAQNSANSSRLRSFSCNVFSTRVDFVAANGQMVVAASLIAGSEAPEAMLARHDEPRSADDALRQARRTGIADAARLGDFLQS